MQELIAKMREAAQKATPGERRYQEGSDAYTHIVRGPNNDYILSAPQGRSGRCEADARLAALCSQPNILKLLGYIEELEKKLAAAREDAARIGLVGSNLRQAVVRHGMDGDKPEEEYTADNFLALMAAIREMDAVIDNQKRQLSGDF